MGGSALQMCVIRKGAKAQRTAKNGKNLTTINLGFEPMSKATESSGLSGNPVFDFNAEFRARGQSVQRVLFLSGVIEIVAGVAGRFVVVSDPAVSMALRWAPWIGVASMLLSGAYGLWWRGKLRADFRREFALKPTLAKPKSAL